MGRPPRLDPEGGWHHVMNRGVDRQDIFADDVDRTEFTRLLAAATKRSGIELHAYCLMSNHFHLLVRCRDRGLSSAVQWCTSQFASWVNDRRGRVGHLFGGRFTSRLVDTEAYCLNVVRYIHRNPLDIAGVDAPAAYRWSSHRAYLGLRRVPHWLQTAQILDWFDGAADFGAFVSEPVSQTVVDDRIDPDALLAALDVVLAERPHHRGRARRSERRAIALAVADRATPATRARLHRHLGLETLSAISSARTRAAHWLETHPEAPPLVDLVVQLVSTPMRPRQRAA